MGRAWTDRLHTPDGSIRDAFGVRDGNDDVIMVLIQHEFLYPMSDGVVAPVDNRVSRRCRVEETGY